MKEYKVTVLRMYTTEITLKFPDDGRDHKEIINENISDGEEMVWDLIAEKELEQMNVDDITWEIQEINNTIINNASDTEDYIKNNTASYPEYSTNSGADVSPDKNAFYSGMNLERNQNDRREITLDDFLTPDLK